MTRSVIIGTGSYVPKKILTNHDLEQMVNTSDEWITSRSGIKTRHIASSKEATSDLALNAARQALEQAGRSPEEVDLIIIATLTPDHFLPSTACLVQAALGAAGATAFDVQAACSGFIYALSVADKFIRLKESSCAVVVGAETLSRIVDWEDRSTCVLFGDGAGAVVLAPSKNRGILSTHCHADGRFKKLLWIPGGGTRIPASVEMLQRRENYVKMAGREVFKVAVKAMEEGAREALEHNGMTADEIDFFVPHQANIRIIRAMIERFGFPEDRVCINLDEVGNTSAASIPLALDKLNRSGAIKSGNIVLLDAFGGGLTWASALIRW